MLVYGDQPRGVRPQEGVAGLARRLGEVEVLGPGLPRHALWVALLVEAGELVQGLCDAVFSERGRDERTRLAFQLGHHVLAAWALEGSIPEEASRLRRVADRHGETLRRLVYA